MNNSIQAGFFLIIKNLLPAHLSLVDEVASLLNLSNDSAYRRIRCETALTLDEAAILSREFKIGMDDLLHSGPGSVNFSYRTLSGGLPTFTTWLKAIIDDLEKIYRAPDKEVIYYAKDIPVFHFFLFPEIARFKIFFWLKTVFDHPELRDKKFSNVSASEEVAGLCQKAVELFSRIPSKEIWSDETINTLLQQIEFYSEAGMFQTPADALLICEGLRNLVTHIRTEAEYSSKFIPGREPLKDSKNFMLYRNEILIGDNTILVNTGDIKTVYIPHNVLNYLVTSNPDFCNRTQESLENLMRKAELISGTSEKARNKYFNGMLGKVNSLIQKLEK